MEHRTHYGEHDDGSAVNGPSAWPALLTAHAVLVGRIEERLRAAGMPELSWYDVLWALDRASDQRLRMHELAELTVISRSNLTRLIDRLQAAGLVERDRGCSDRRGAYAVLTKAGRDKRRAMWKVYSQAIAELFDGHLSAQENAMMRNVLKRLLDAARDSGSG